MKIGIIGDLHFKEKLGYADFVSGQRKAEKDALLKSIAKKFQNHHLVVLLGDNLNSKNNPSSVIKDFVGFLSEFNVPLVILAGNHEKYGDGRSAIDFLEHIDNPWTPVIRGPQSIEIKNRRLHFLPYMSKVELMAKDNDEARLKIQQSLEVLPKSDILFAHHAFSGIMEKGVDVSTFNEPILDRDWLKEHYKQVVIGHIHTPKEESGFLTAGSIFCNEVGEIEKFIWALNVDDDNGSMKVERHPLKQLGIKKIQNPTQEDLEGLDPKKYIIKAEITDRSLDIATIKKQLKRFAGSVIVERYPNERVSVKADSDIADYSVESLLGLYAKAKKVDLKLLLKGYELIK